MLYQSTRDLNAKKIEGCSDRTITYYRGTIEHLLAHISTPVRKITTDEVRSYLVDYQQINNCSKVTVDNVRRNISSLVRPPRTPVPPWLPPQYFVSILHSWIPSSSK